MLTELLCALPVAVKVVFLPLFLGCLVFLCVRLLKKLPANFGAFLSRVSSRLDFVVSGSTNFFFKFVLFNTAKYGNISTCTITRWRHLPILVFIILFIISLVHYSSTLRLAWSRRWSVYSRCVSILLIWSASVEVCTLWVLSSELIFWCLIGRCTAALLGRMDRRRLHVCNHWSPGRRSAIHAGQPSRTVYFTFRINQFDGLTRI